VREKNDLRVLFTGLLALVIGVPLLMLWIALALAVAAFDAYVVWKGWMWHLVPAGAPAVTFTVVWVVKMLAGMMTAHLVPKKEEGRGWAWFFARPIGALFVLALLWWLR
jgi:disulfide bond formation protein DsbB